MNCDFIIPMDSDKLFAEFENAAKYTLPDTFKKFIKVNNGGTPDEDCFLTKTGIERVINCFCSFNHDDEENIWSYLEWDPVEWNLDELEGKYVIFADDPFGNLIAFEKSTDKVVFICLDTRPGEPALDYVADSFEEFIDKCYLSEDDEEDFDDEE